VKQGPTEISQITISSLHTVLHLYILRRDRSSVWMQTMCIHTMGACMCVYIGYIWWVLYSIYNQFWSLSVIQGLVVLTDITKTQTIKTCLN